MKTWAVEFLVAMAVISVAMVLGVLLGSEAGLEMMCKQWAGSTALVHEGECMVKTKDGGLRPARKDGE